VPDLVPENRIEQPPAQLGDLKPGQSMVVHRARLSVTNGKQLVLLKKTVWEKDDLTPQEKVVISRDTEGTWCADLSGVGDYRIKRLPMQDLLTDNEQFETLFITIDKIRW
jgi:hypothetical protein